MSAPPQHEEDDFAPSSTPGYKPGGVKNVDELAQLDAEDESLARWKASLGIVPGAAAAVASGPKVTILSLELASPSMPADKTLSMELANPAEMESMKKNPVHIKEGVLYNVRIKFKVNHSIISGVKYIQVVKRSGIKVDKMEQMLGSYGPTPTGEPHVKNFPEEESPSGLLARSGTYNVRSRVVDDDGEIYAAWSITMAAYATEAPLTTPLTYLGLFGLGALIMRSAGCTINDMADRDFDKSVVAGSANWEVVLPLYAGGICWTLVYDTIYAHQDKDDDVKVGVRSTALLFGDHTRTILSAFSASSISLFTYAGLINGQGLPFYTGVGLAGVQLARILYKTDFNSRPSCWQGFKDCGRAGAFIWAGALADYGLLLGGVQLPTLW
ncbi:hypothetical protein EW026_g6164 [Hermanssonia centrifuga]|uniref:Uncharacterized protein n=1 Tax=Hermanssonia centrifuga TaxID=98765 RepID=A0A4S4KBX3_9APHY|nr:hypothetical protein EW026_g6164 [Hermanssonia centrifuga]